jgi:hypothetical protein
MKLTIEQALQQRIAAHKKGKRLYRAILQSQTLHPDANYNLRLIAVSVNKAEAALPLFKTLPEANPIKEKQFENAKQVIEQAKTQGMARDKVDDIKAQITTTTTQVNKVN